MYHRPPSALITDMTTTQGDDDMTNETQEFRPGYGWVTPSAAVAAVLAQEPAAEDEVA